MNSNRHSRGNNIASKFKKLPRKPKKVSLIDEKCDWNGSVFPFKGTKELLEEEDHINSDYDDDEWSISTPKLKIKLNNALGALMGAYMSGDDSEEEPVEVPISITRTQLNQVPPDEQAKDLLSIVTEQKTCGTGVGNQTGKPEVCEISDVDSPPTEAKIVKEQKIPYNEKVQTDAVQSQSIAESRIKERKRKRSHLKQRNNKKFNKQSKDDTLQKPKDFPYKFKKRKITLLEKLLENEIRHERNMLLQCVRYVVSNNFFDKDITDDKQTSSTNTIVSEQRSSS